MHELLEHIQTLYNALNRDGKTEVIRHVLENKPKGVKLRDIVEPNGDMTGFDLDLVDGQAGECAFLNIATSGKHEVKRDFQVSDTGNVAVELEYKGNKSGLNATESPYWVFWLSGERYRDEVAVVITTDRLKRVSDGCRETNGGDGRYSRLRLVPVQKLVKPLEPR